MAHFCLVSIYHDPPHPPLLSWLVRVIFLRFFFIWVILLWLLRLLFLLFLFFIVIQRIIRWQWMWQRCLHRAELWEDVRSSTRLWSFPFLATSRHLILTLMVIHSKQKKVRCNISSRPLQPSGVFTDGLQKPCSKPAVQIWMQFTV
jgi:hypothetical protein